MLSFCHVPGFDKYNLPHLESLHNTLAAGSISTDRAVRDGINVVRDTMARPTRTVLLDGLWALLCEPYHIDDAKFAPKER